MPPLETETVVETFERVRFDSHVSQELRGLCSMIKRLMSARLRSRELREAAAAQAAEENQVAEPEAQGPPHEGNGRKKTKTRRERKSPEGQERSRRYNLRIIGVPEAEDKANEAQAVVQALIEENFPELQDGSGLQIEKAHRVPAKFNEKKVTPRHILVTFLHLSDKEKIVQMSRQRKEVTYNGLGVRLASDFSPAVLKARRQWSSIYRALEEKGFEPRILYPARLSFVYEGKRKIFPDMQALRKFIAQVPCLENLLNDLLLPMENES